MQKTTKTQTKNLWILLLVVTVIVLSLVAKSYHKTNQMKIYAKANNCTWYATGTMYGDDRDFICK